MKGYVQDLLARGWVVKSKSLYVAPVVCVQKERWYAETVYRLQILKSDRRTSGIPEEHGGDTELAER